MLDSTASFYFSMLLLIVVGIGLTIFALIYGIKKNWKLPKAERERSAKRFILASVVLYLLCKFGGGTYFAYLKGKDDAEQAGEILKQASILLTHNADIKECDKKAQTGEIKSNVDSYLCKKPFIMQAFKNAGIKHSDSLDAISNKFIEIETKADKGESSSPEEYARFMLNVIEHDESEP